VSDDLLTPQDAARRLGLAVTTLYDWLGRSTVGLLSIGGERTSIEHYQTGPKQQGRIRIPAREIDRLLSLMRVQPQLSQPRRPSVCRDALPGITVPLGRPE
jgi:hypothetical protein